MKWEMAIKKIEKAMAEGKKVEIEYHRKWMKQDSHFDVVYSINEYDWHGDICKAVSTYHDGLDEDSHIIDAVKITEVTKDQMLDELVSMANQLVKDYSYDLNKRMWTACSDWNRKHPEEEIFMYETDDGFAIEDDVWILPKH